MKNPKYITLEGPDGSGKATQVKITKNKLIERGLEVLATREPGGTDMGYKIRNILLDPDSEDLCNKAELLLYCADRAQHFEEVIKPTLASGKSILSDRGPDATLLYQGFGRGLDLKLINQLNDIALDGHLPDLTIFIAGDVEYFLRRAWKSVKETGDTQTRFEQEKIDFHKRVLDGVYRLTPTNKRYAIVEDKEGDLEYTVNEKIMRTIYERLDF